MTNVIASFIFGCILAFLWQYGGWIGHGQFFERPFEVVLFHSILWIIADINDNKTN